MNKIAKAIAILVCFCFRCFFIWFAILGVKSNLISPVVVLIVWVNLNFGWVTNNLPVPGNISASTFDLKDLFLKKSSYLKSTLALYLPVSTKNFRLGISSS